MIGYRDRGIKTLAEADEYEKQQRRRELVDEYAAVQVPSSMTRRNAASGRAARYRSRDTAAGSHSLAQEQPPSDTAKWLAGR
eukprot:SAG31_NODE_30164_length_384_cov_2.136842_1_plen_81_part_01